jgi:REP element-mobilizing transposase RayT
MRQPRLTWKGAFHHCMNRGLRGENIFEGDEDKHAFLELMGEKAQRFRVRVLAWCLMSNHYHLVVQNASGRMVDFFRNLNMHYAFYYRKTYGGKGYLFQGRYASTLIQDDSYLKPVIAYVLRNPLLVGLAADFRAYRWSSGACYWGGENPAWLDAEFVRGLFGNEAALAWMVQSWKDRELPVARTRLGPILGDVGFFSRARKRFERRKEEESEGRRRKGDFGFDPVPKVIREFEKKHGIQVEKISTSTYSGKRLRGELLVALRDRAGLRYRKIAEMEPFTDLNYLSMGHIYLQSLARMGKREYKK